MSSNMECPIFKSVCQVNFNAKDAEVFAKDAEEDTFAYLCECLSVFCV